LIEMVNQHGSRVMKTLNHFIVIAYMREVKTFHGPGVCVCCVKRI
jgi:hypothetical protein